MKIERLLDPLAGESGMYRTMRKTAKMTARISLSFVILSLVLVMVSVISYGVSRSTPMIIGMAAIFFAIFLINCFRLPSLSSFLLCTVPSILLMLITISLKRAMPGDDLHYYDSRIILVAFCALPGMVYSPREPVLIYTTVLLNFCCLVFYDPIHEALGLGYYQRGFLNPTYYHINTIAIVMSASIIAGSLMLKNIVVMEEDKNAKLLQERQEQNNALETQNEEITAQTEQLAAAFAIIENQRDQLENNNTLLEEQMRVKSADLKHSNDVLQKYNSELRQFSYTVSHNLRAPVARMMGLSALLELDDRLLSAENRQLLSLLKDSSHELDTIIRELSRIIDIRNDLYTAKQKVFFSEEWQHVYKSLEGQVDQDMVIETDFSEAAYIYTIRPFLHSILYNLVGNAIRYRSPQRKLRVAIKTHLKPGVITLTVKDNGLGINLDQFGKNIFGMYKRFHTHVEGRGIGLYLVKTQVEALNGEITVASELNKGTTFSIDITLPVDIEGQMCYDCDYGSILYNARTNAMGLVWKRQVQSDDYRFLMTKCLEMLHVYGTPHWIVDLRKRGDLKPEDHQWAADSIMNEAQKNGLRKIAFIDEPGQAAQRSGMIKNAARFNVEVRYFLTRGDAEAWNQ